MTTAYRRILLHTGNILDSEELVRKVGQTTLEELQASVKTTLNFSSKEKQVFNGDGLTIRGLRAGDPSHEPKSGLMTTVKIFMSTSGGHNLSDAIFTVRSELQIKRIDSVIILPPDVSDDLSLTELKPAWKTLQSQVRIGAVSNIGIADISASLFKELYDWAEIKPSTIQVNISSCCTISEDLKQFANENEVQILTHYDDPEVIDEEVVDTILNKFGVSGMPYEVLWLARHRSIQTSYGVISDKGYTLALQLNE